MSDEKTEYQKEYEAAMAKLDAGEKLDEVKVETPPVEVTPEIKEPPKEETPAVSEIDELREKVAKAEKMAKDNQAWATRVSQEASELRRQREQEKREATKPTILDANPELADAIRYVNEEPKRDETADFAWVVESAHPGIFAKEIDPELEAAIITRIEANPSAKANPLEFIRIVTEEKLSATERQVGKRFAAESSKLAQKSAMSVPSASSGVKTSIDAELESVNRIKNMSDAEFAKEVKRAKGL
jgi:hypothetical protein